ncbi:MAG TPA: ribosome silencing factor [Candidatus Hydrogenedentes bacterium]|nr:ribosome silencing factor [Candidatus Hydrogenedentota bacterium]HOJ69232.1 ribosome silencing factor [Candidatus Hydrogenedentota bacterium]HOK90555.1 ribosome silencing factor [Candidatus Hydrogenedentota bacterium]HOV59791.1 ribosome silencing factor [Candidatus Hydrogenedentota bacterium]
MAERVTEREPLSRGVLNKLAVLRDIVADKKARDLKMYDVRGLTLLADVFVLCSVTSEPQMRAVAGAAREEMKEAGFAPLRLEGTHRSGWLVADFGDVIFHVFRETAREFYDLDRLWADAPEVPENHIPALRGIHPDG